MRRLAFIDLLRGIAILSVLVCHLPTSFGPYFGDRLLWGGRGVDLFFVLSGFLIGSTCLRRSERASNARSQAKSYWLLRCARIWPIYYPLLALLASGVPPFDPEPARVLREHLAPYIFFYSNDVAQPSLELGVLWSLAIEEQFYLVIGLLIWLAGKERRLLEVAFACAGVMSILVALRFRTDLQHVLTAGLSPPYHTFLLFFATLARIDQLGIGLLCAVLAPVVNTWRPAVSGRWARVTTWAAVALVVVALRAVPPSARWGFTELGLLLGAAVLWCQRPAAEGITLTWTERALALAVGHAGKVSFGFYVFHPIARRWVIHLFEARHWPLEPSHATRFLVIWGATTWLIAAASFRFYERPILKWAHGRADAWLAAMPRAAPSSGP